MRLTRDDMERLVKAVQLQWTPGMTLEWFERQAVLAAYKYFQGNKSQTADALGITLKTLYSKLEAYGFHEGATATTAKENQAGNIPRVTQKNEGTKPASVQAEGGVRVQPTVETPSQLPVSVQQREKVQTLPPKQSTGNTPKRRTNSPGTTKAV